MHRVKWLVVLGAMFAGNAIACDWTVSKTTDPMTDRVMCKVTSPAANITFYRNGTDAPNVVTGSAYSSDGLQIRIDENPAIRMGDNAGARQRALASLMPQVESGQRIRVRYKDYPNWQDGDAPICTLPALLRSCAE